MAALVFQHQLELEGLADVVTVSSAGTGGWHQGDPADRRAQKVLADHGYPTGHSASEVTEYHLGADLVVALDGGHARALKRLTDPAKVRLLRSFDPLAGDDLEVPDPYYGDLRGFEETLEMVEAAMPELLDWVRARLP
ncbi:low molecular weight phosphotyrosine protein phosphatase [Pseudonocardiaceae bacterium YIM PH 21723]|nr:low molecular weight phosphotyrosine protein phosphatase [Pseudonocardiaceae bacterium YIM PH 21723]